jgi:hypothetical protein
LLAFLPPTQLPHESFQPVTGQPVAGTGVDLRLPLVLPSMAVVLGFSAVYVTCDTGVLKDVLFYFLFILIPFRIYWLLANLKAPEGICMYIESY